MKELTVKVQSGDSRIVVAPFSTMGRLIAKPPSVLIADSEVKRLYPQYFNSCPLIEIEGGEQCKSIEILQHLYEQFLSLGVDRGAHIVIVGGGTVCDVASFAASTYMRGVTASLVPTTLLAQVDAGIGGKNGINFGGFKNIAGTISQPALVLCDTAFLKTLPVEMIRGGYAEIIKHAAIADRAYFDFLNAHVNEALALDADVIDRVVFDSLAVKSQIVSRDEKESGERMKLNFGHTVGHAVESRLGLPHGEAVSIGMVVEARLSVHRGLLPEESYALLGGLLAAYGLPVKLKGDPAELKSALWNDKKRRGAEIGMTLLNGIGASAVERISISEVEGLIDAMCGT